jgi:hypothetical protein
VFSRFTPRNCTFFTAASGFIFLSALVAGYVYGNYAYGDWKELRRRVFRRAAAVYAGHASVAVIFFLLIILGLRFQETGEYEDMYSSPQKYLLVNLLLLYQHGFFNILPMYVVFLLLVPFLLKRFDGRGGSIVLIASFALWLIAQFGATDELRAYITKVVPSRFTVFDIFAIGTAIGYRTLRQKTLRFTFPKWSLIVAGVFVIVLSGLRLSVTLNLDVFHLSELNGATDRDHLGWLRLVDFGLTAYIVAWLAHRFSYLFRWTWLTFIGQHSLQVFSYHIIAVLMLRHFEADIIAAGTSVHMTPPFTRVIITIVLLLSLTIPAALHASYRQVRLRRRASMSGIPVTSYFPEGGDILLKANVRL